MNKTLAELEAEAEAKWQVIREIDAAIDAAEKLHIDPLTVKRSDAAVAWKNASNAVEKARMRAEILAEKGTL